MCSTFDECSTFGECLYLPNVPCFQHKHPGFPERRPSSWTEVPRVCCRGSVRLVPEISKQGWTYSFFKKNWQTLFAFGSVSRFFVISKWCPLPHPCMWQCTEGTVTQSTITCRMLNWCPRGIPSVLFTGHLKCRDDGHLFHLCNPTSGYASEVKNKLWRLIAH